ERQPSTADRSATSPEPLCQCSDSNRRNPGDKDDPCSASLESALRHCLRGCGLQSAAARSTCFELSARGFITSTGLPSFLHRQCRDDRHCGRTKAAILASANRVGCRHPSDLVALGASPETLNVICFRQDNAKSGSAVNLGLILKRAAVLFNDTGGDGQPKTR